MSDQVTPDAHDDLRPLTDLSEHRLWDMIESAPDGMLTVDGDGTILVVNRQIESMFGYDRVELLGSKIETLLPARLREVHAEHRDRYGLDPAVRAMGTGLDLWGRHRDGTEFPVEVSLAPTIADDGTPAVVASVRDISDRVAADRHSAMIRRSIDAVSDAVLVFDEDSLECVYVNDGAVALHGYSRAEFLGGMTVHQVAAAFSRDVVDERLDALSRSTDHSVRFVGEGRHKDGSTVPVEVRLDRPLPERPGDPRPIVAVVRDISEQVASEARFRGAFDMGPVPMALVEVTASDRVITEANQAMADLLGYDRDELVGKSFIELTHPDDLAPDDAAATGMVSGQVEQYAPLKRYVRRDGTTVWVQLHAAAIGPRNGRVTGIAHAVDVTSELVAAASEARQKALGQSLSRIRLAMLRDASRQEGLTLICESAVDCLDADTALILTPADVGDELIVEASVNIADHVLRGLSFQKTGGVVGEVFATGEIQLAGPNDARFTETNRTMIDAYGMESVVTAPLNAGGITAGVLLVVRHSGAQPLGHDDLAAIETFASEAVIAIELAALSESHRHLELLEDRERIGRDMHDNVIGRLFATGMGLQAAAGRLIDAEDRERLTEAVSEIDETIAEIRNTIYGLKSQVGWGRGVRGEILALAEQHAGALGFEPQVRLTGAIDELDRNVVEDLLSTVREALTNVAKHARARNVTLTLDVDIRGLRMTVGDDGAGFDPYANGDIAASELTSHGLSNMRARAEGLGGRFAITSAPGSGTTVELTIPLQDEDGGADGGD